MDKSLKSINRTGIELHKDIQKSLNIFVYCLFIITYYLAGATYYCWVGDAISACGLGLHLGSCSGGRASALCTTPLRYQLLSQLLRKLRKRNTAFPPAASGDQRFIQPIKGLPNAAISAGFPGDAPCASRRKGHQLRQSTS